MKVDTYKINVYTFLTPPTVTDYKGSALCVLSRLYVIHSEFEFNSQNRNGWHSHYNCNAWHRVHSHQESPLVHLLWSGLNTMLIFFVWCGPPSHCPLYKWTRIFNKTTLKVLRSFIHWFTHSTVPEFIWNLFSLVSVRLFWCTPECNCCIQLLYLVWFDWIKLKFVSPLGADLLDRCEYTQSDSNRWDQCKNRVQVSQWRREDSVAEKRVYYKK